MGWEPVGQGPPGLRTWAWHSRRKVGSRHFVQRRHAQLRTRDAGGRLLADLWRRNLSYFRSTFGTSTTPDGHARFATEPIDPENASETFLSTSALGTERRAESGEERTVTQFLLNLR